MSIDYRNNDAVLTICQNNKAQTITISSINKSAQELTGFSEDDMVGFPLKKFLPERIVELLNEYVEYENNAHDVGEVLGKVQSFSIIGKDGKEKAYKLKVLQAESGAGNLFFSLVLRDVMGVRKNDAIRSAIQENFKGHEVVSLATGLPDKNSLIRDIELIKRYSSVGVNSCFAMLQIDHADELTLKYGEEVFNEIVKHAAVTARQCLRPDDVLASINSRRIGVLLVEIDFASARMVFNRLRWQIAATPFVLPDKSQLGLSVSMSFCKVYEGMEGAEILENNEKYLSGLSKNSHNILVEATVD